MNFKTKEGIKQEEKDNICPHLLSEKMFVDGFNNGVDSAFKSFAEHVEFYKKYRTNPDDLYKDERDIWNKFVKYHNSYYDCNNVKDLNGKKLWTTKFVLKMVWNEGTSIEFYNDWLFDYCFGDVIE